MKSLEDYKKDDWYEYEKCSYEDAESLLQIGLLGFCGCGRPEENLLYVLAGLELISEARADRGKEDFDSWWDGYKNRILEHFGSEDAAYFFYYWADKEGFTAHGGSVPGWLNGKGKDMLALLHEWKSLQSPTPRD